MGEGGGEAMLFKVTVGGRQYTVEIENPSQNPLSVIVDGRRFTVVVEGVGATPSIPPPQEAPRPEGPKTIPQSQVISRFIAAPMPGKVVSVVVSVGDRVAYGDVVCILEAMKMEQTIRSSQEGLVKRVHVVEGQSVAYNTPLVELE
ncbi:MAG: hypothetical protein HYU86_12425 [Chloroflexi bacterium]|nr:hypothetical protein [Chloroflexota bacterium]